MKVAVTGGTGLVGRFIVNGLLSDGHDVTVMTRTPPQPGFFAREVVHRPYDLDAGAPDLRGMDAVVLPPSIISPAAIAAARATIPKVFCAAIWTDRCTCFGPLKGRGRGWCSSRPARFTGRSKAC